MKQHEGSSVSGAEAGRRMRSRFFPPGGNGIGEPARQPEKHLAEARAADMLLRNAARYREKLERAAVMKAFDGKVAVITGGAHGIGRAAPAPGTHAWQNIEGMDFHD